MTEDIKHWLAVIHYKTDSGLLDVTHELDELEDLHDIVEHGPNFYSIDHITCTIHPDRQVCIDDVGTVENANTQ